ncbi:unnamed protein product [Musa acuminata subsp. malaccensis]|uniref:(wild Malaysian banana) hypothetical protein n=1 Tax=Musa acuminata subsp. malaccensis TaxID=214687 RepID=A0A804IJX0_MUSAM|nr:PREDICTED: chaperone protein dnaJ 11, chloroplastic-like [Musa acuminata subsp. malaccensis]CAG1840907.1 unnamed protein product [Musa acuminata subsp. malaccensis]
MSGTVIFSGISFSPARGISAQRRVVAQVATAAGRSRAPASLYQVLRVGETATAREIKAAYRAMAKRFHPDAAPAGEGPDFLEIRSAYETLSDPAARARYDRSIVGRIPRAGFVVSDRQRFTKWETDQCW